MPDERKVRLQCDCGSILRAPARLLGKEVLCPTCGAIVEVPAEARPVAPRAPRGRRAARTGLGRLRAGSPPRIPRAVSPRARPGPVGAGPRPALRAALGGRPRLPAAPRAPGRRPRGAAPPRFGPAPEGEGAKGRSSRLIVGIIAGGIALLLAAIFVVVVMPALGGSKVAANESSAIASLKAIAAAEEQFKAKGGKGRYGPLHELSGAKPAFLDATLGAARKNGYSFRLVLGDPAGTAFYVQASPLTPGKTGSRRLFVDATGAIRFHAQRAATSGDSPVE